MIELPRGIDSLLVTHMPNVRYMSGFSGSSGAVLVTPRNSYLFTDFRYRQQALREAGRLRVRIVPGEPAGAALAYAVRRGIALGTLGFEGGRLSQRDCLRLRRMLRGVAPMRDAGDVVEQARTIKSRAEVARIAAAAAIADDALGRLTRTSVVGRTESEVAWRLERWMREAGSAELPFSIIVASGPRSAMPHGTAGARVIRAGDLVVVDLGARVSGYASDITRTFAAGGVSRRKQEIYRIVREAQEQALGALRGGERCSELDRVARDYISSKGFGGAFGHALGHGVGLEPHEAPTLSSRSRETLAAGMVVTVEPGVYIEGVGGVRIEDTVAVTKSGYRRLTGFSHELISLG